MIRSRPNSLQNKLTQSRRKVNFKGSQAVEIARSHESSRDEVFVSIQVNLAQSNNRKSILRAKLDTGVQGNMVPMRLYREMYPHQIDNNGKLKPNTLLSSNVVLTTYGNSPIKHHGIVTIPCNYWPTYLY